MKNQNSTYIELLKNHELGSETPELVASILKSLKKNNLNRRFKKILNIFDNCDFILYSEYSKKSIIKTPAFLVFSSEVIQEEVNILVSLMKEKVPNENIISSCCSSYRELKGLKSIKSY